MLGFIRENWDRLSGVGAGVTIAFFAFSIDARVADMQSQDDRWLERDNAQAADQLAAIEEVRTAQGLIIGRLDGAGGALWIYELGHRDGAAGCRP